MSSPAADWQARLAAQPGLAESLAEFVENKLPQAV